MMTRLFQMSMNAWVTMTVRTTVQTLLDLTFATVRKVMN